MEHFDGLCSVNLQRTEHIWINVDLRFTERWGQRVKVIHNCMQMLGTLKLQHSKNVGGVEVKKKNFPAPNLKMFFMLI